MAETLSENSLGEALARYIRQLSKDPSLKDKSSNEVEAIALQKAKETLEKRAASGLQTRRNAVEKRKAQELAEQIKSDDPKVQKKALEEMEKGKYPANETIDEAKKHLKYAQEARADAPSWLKIDDLSTSVYAVELSAAISGLPHDLQNDPDVLYKTLGSFYASVRWSDVTIKERSEARLVMNRVLRRIAELKPNDPGYTRSKLLDGLDPAPNYIHLDIPEDIPSVREMPKDKNGKPNESDPDYDKWVDEKIAQMQARRLKHLLEGYQDILDIPENLTPLNQREQIRELLKKLTNGIVNGAPIYGIRERPPEILKKDALYHIEYIQNRLNKLNGLISAENQSLHGRVVRYDDIKDRKWFADLDPKGIDKDKLKTIFQFHAGHWPPGEVERLLEVGYREWFYEFCDRIFGLGTERVQPDIVHAYIYNDFKNFLIALYGSNADIVFSEFGTYWEKRPQLDFIAHSVGLGAGDSKRRLEAMSIYQSSDEDFLLHFKYANLAFSFTDRETIGLLGDKMSRDDEIRRWLEEKVDNPFYSGDRKATEKWVNKFYKGKDHEVTEKIINAYGEHSIPRDVYYYILRAEKMRSPDVFASGELAALLDEIQLKMEQRARGVILEDTDIWGYVDYDIHLVKVSESMKKLQAEFDGGILSDEERQSFVDDMKSLQTVRDRLLSKKRLKLDELGVGDDPVKLLTALNARRGLGVIENRVFDRMKEYLDLTGEKVTDTELRQAIWAARNHAAITGRFAEIGASMARIPGNIYHDMAGAKDIMRAPAFEDLVRIMNPEMFAYRFNMGGKMGEIVRSYLRYNLRVSRLEEGVDAGTRPINKKYFDTDEWKKLKESLTSNQDKLAANLMEFAENDLGIKFTELLAPGFLGTGGQWGGSSWRSELGVLDEIKKYYLDLRNSGALPPDAVLDNQALAIRYLIAANEEERKYVLERMMKRTPTKFFQLLSDKRNDLLREVGLPIDEKTWQAFDKALKYAETRLSLDKNLIAKSIDLADPHDFDEHLKPLLVKLLADAKLPNGDADISQYRKLIEKVQDRLKADAHGKPYKSILDGLAKEKLPLTLALDDLNWSDVNMKVLGNLAYPRRTRDLGNMDQTKNIILEFMSNTESILSPDDPVITLKKFKELKLAIDSYAGPQISEPTLKKLMTIFIETNRDRSLWSLPSWLPTGKSMGLQLAEQDWRANARYRSPVGKVGFRLLNTVGNATLGNLAKATSKVPVLNNVMNWVMPGWKQFSTEPFEKWPHSIAEAISFSVRFTGAHGNRWDEKKIDDVLHTAQDMGLFTDNPNFIHDLRGEFKAGGLMKNLSKIRRFWWVIVVATVSVAALESMEEEKKKGH